MIKKYNKKKFILFLFLWDYMASIRQQKTKGGNGGLEFIRRYNLQIEIRNLTKVSF